MGHTPAPGSAYDDQGLFFSLILSALLMSTFSAVLWYLFSSPALHLQRFYRPNHTLEPPPRSRGTSPQSPTPVHHPNDGFGRHKRLGVCLPYTPTLLRRPRLRDWLRIEEDLPHVQPVCPPTGRRDASLPAVADAKKTPLDPQVALYLFTLKYFATLMILGGVFTVWNCTIASGDDYLVRYMVRRDIRSCHKHDRNETTCEKQHPYCTFRGVDEGCFPVPLHGLYEMTVQNIEPRSPRWWGVGLLNLGFCLTFVATTLYAVRTMSHYIQSVMRLQMRHALGYRVVCVRGFSTREAPSITAFTHAYLSEAAYFPPRETSSVAGSGSRHDGRRHRYEILEWTGTGSFFSALYFQHYVLGRRDAVFTRSERVQELLFTRTPPPGMYRAIGRAEAALAALQEAVADEKALRRRHHARGTRRPNGRAGTAAASIVVLSGEDVPREAGGGCSAVEEPRREQEEEEEATDTTNTNNTNNTNAAAVLVVPADDVTLLLWEPFPRCRRRPAVAYRRDIFTRRAARLNEAIAQVPQQGGAGAAFVVFVDSHAAFAFMALFQARHGGWTSRLVASLAGPPGCIIENNLHVPRTWLLLRCLLLAGAYVVLLGTWTIPVGFLGSLDNLALLPGIGPSLHAYYLATMPESLQAIATAYLPVVMLAVFNLALPFLIRFCVIAMGAFNRLECESGHFFLQYLFMVLTAVVLQAALQGSLAQLADLIADPTGEAIKNFFFACVTPTGGYWYAKVLMATSLNAFVELLDPVGLLTMMTLRGAAHVQRTYDALFAPCLLRLPQWYCADLVILAMGLLFHMTAPLLVPFVAVYFLTRYWLQRAKLYDRYRPARHPVRDCSDFGLSAMVFRSVAALFCLAETGGVMLMSLRSHTGGVVLCSLALAAGLLTLAYVYMRTGGWVASLGKARAFAQEAATAAAAAKRTPSPPPEGHETSRCGDGEESPGPQSPVGPSAGENMDEYEYQRFHFFASRPNPFTGHLLPRLSGVSSRYQPKHQRLALIDVQTEVENILGTVFIVERYWDRSMSWFEEDEAARREVWDGEHVDCGHCPTATTAVARVHTSSGGSEPEQSSSRTSSPATISATPCQFGRREGESLGKPSPRDTP